MSISTEIPDDYAEFVQTAILSGRFASARDVISESLRLLQQHSAKAGIGAVGRQSIGEDEAMAALQMAVADARADEPQAVRFDESRVPESLVRQTAALMRLSKSQAIVRGELTAAWNELCELAALTLDVARVGIWLFSADLSVLRCAHVFTRGRQEQPEDLELTAADYPAYFQALESSRTITAHDAQTDVRTAPFADSYLRPLGITSMMDSTIRSEGRVLGVVCHEHIGRQRDWLPQEAAFSASIADFAARAIEFAERRRIEQEREALIRELEARNAELERFNYTVSHDLKAPLITIKGYLGVLERDLARRDQQRIERDMRAIGGAADRMSHLLQQLLELSRAGKIADLTERINLNELADEVVQHLAVRIASAGGTVQILAGLPTVVGDRVRLREVLQNLIENSLKFQQQPGLGVHIEIGAERRDGEQVCFVADNGIGIEPEYHDKVFGLFERLSVEHEGTGVGLALVKRIIEVHGGRIWVESAGTGQGCRFCFTFGTEVGSAAPADILVE